MTLLPFTNGLDLGFLAAGAEMAGGGGVLYPQLDPADTRRLRPIVWVLGVADDALAGAHGGADAARRRHGGELRP